MILKLENINKDWEKLNERLGVNIKLIHDNKSSINKKDIVDSLSKKTKQKIYKIFKDDFEKLNYESNI